MESRREGRTGRADKELTEGVDCGVEVIQLVDDRLRARG
jgi:hypothetical protein